MLSLDKALEILNKDSEKKYEAVQAQKILSWFYEMARIQVQQYLTNEKAK